MPATVDTIRRQKRLNQAAAQSPEAYEAAMQIELEKRKQEAAAAKKNPKTSKIKLPSAVTNLINRFTD